MSQKQPFEYVRYGQMPFFRLPTALPHEGGYVGNDVILLGVPWDGGTTSQPGSRYAPFHVRRVSGFLQSFHPVHKLDVFGKIRVADGGNVVFPPFDPPAARAMIEGEVTSVLEAGAVPVLLGGDHSITLPAMRAVAKKHGPLACVHVDAHLDTSDDAIWGDAYHHGTPIRHALRENLIAKDALHQVGIRAIWNTPEDGAFAASYGARCYTMDEIDDRGIAIVAAQIRAAIGDRPTYLTIDVDGIDPAFAPGTGSPVPGGLTSREVIRLVQGIAGLNIVGADVVEVCPAVDVGEATLLLAAQLQYEAVALVAFKHR